MSRNVKFAWGVSALALTVSAFSAPAVRAQDGQQEVSNLDEVVVTARRRDENMQDVPVAVTAITGATLAAKGVTNAIELARQVPNVTIGAASTSPQLLTIGVRGVRQKEGHMFFDPSVVTIYADSVVAHPYGFGDTLYDVANIQILKGPQGTLFGRNSPAGALIITPNYASTTEGFAGSVAASLGSYQRQKYDLVLNIPLGDRAAFRIAAEHFEREGYVTNILSGQRWNGLNNDSVRASLTLEPTDNFRNTTIVDWLDEESSPAGTMLFAYLPGGSGNLVGGVANARRLAAEQQALGPWRFATFAGTGRLPQDLLNPAFCAPGSPRPFQVQCSRSHNENNWLKSWGVVNRTEWDLGGVTLKNFMSYRKFRRTAFQTSWSVAFADGTGGPGNHAITGSPDGIETWTEEFQLSGHGFDNRLSWVSGLFGMKDKGEETNWSYQGIGAAVPTSQNIAATTMDTRSWGAYAQGTFALTDRLNLTGGIRYSNDNKKVTSGGYNIDAVTGVITCNYFGANNVRLPANPAQCVLFGDKDWSAVTWNVSLDYDITPGTMVYGTVSRGYRAGGFFGRAIRPSLFSYDPEFVTNYEAGVKSEWRLFDRPIRTNLSAYIAGQTEMQVQVQDATNVPLSGFINNAGEAQYTGGEFEMLYQATDALTLQGFASYTDFKYKEYRDPTGDLSYQTAPQPISHWTVGASADYRIDLGDDSALNLRADVSWVSDIVVNNIFPNAKGDWPGDAYTILNLRADWTKPFGQPVDIGFWVTNVTNDFYANGTTCLSGLCQILPSPPRMWGVDLKYHFGG